MAFIHPSAEVDKTAQIADSAEIARGAYVGPHCIIGENVKIGMNAIVECHTEIGDGTILAPNAHVGGAPQDYSYKNEDTKLIIGKNCVIREFAPIHRATTKEDWKTEIGDNCLIMALSHIGHDCKFGNNVTLVASMIPGHIHIDDYALISGYAALHQGVHIGTMAMVSGMSRISLDVPPYCIAADPVKGRIAGLNVVGLKRRGVSAEARMELSRALKIFLNRSYSLDEAKERLKDLNQLDEVVKFREFIEASSRRGITRV